MIACLLLGRENSQRFPNKHFFKLFGRALMEYPILAAKNSKYINHIFISTDSKEISKIAQNYNINLIERPIELATSTALVENVVNHAYKAIKQQLPDLDILVVLFCNVGTIVSDTIDKGIELLKNNSFANSVATVANIGKYSPYRAKKINDLGFLASFIEKTSANLDSSLPCYFYDCCLWITKKNNIELMDGYPRFSWLGKNVIPLLHEGGLDVNTSYDMILTECWLKYNNFSDDKTPYDK